MKEIEVERKEPRVEYFLERIVEEMLKEGMTSFSDTRDYKITLKDKTEKKTLKDTITATIEIRLTGVPDTLLEMAREEE